ncbi:TonB-dependent receptor [Rhodospirillum centenum]|uniref:TonB-dependent receptor, putative n=1 Tax=Rhodospirillum centenum (strain ATCC 51521 / SW) TaxID=414684 RepID=B6INS5_RHOCS|nr:TonB-dependent receptor [Rhodospirillum centenum]ACI99259.1 TonB-dependent receptor, putative [Rhodospirillum centenum SW]
MRRTSMAAAAALLPSLSAAVTVLHAFPAGAAPVEEIVITARQREENPQRVPVSVTVLDATLIERARVDSIAGIAVRAPGLVVSDPFGRFNPAPAIRGLTQPGTGEEPSVGFFLDGVYVSGRSSINLFLNDLERVEVLKGPQNALFGRNTFGGAVNLVTRRPGDTLEGFAEAGFGSKQQRQAAAAVGGPLIPGKLAARASVSLRDYGGFYDNALAGGPEIGSEKSVAGALTLRATPTERLEALLRVSYAEDDDGQPKGYYLATNCEPRAATGVFSQYCGAIPESSGPFAANPEHFGFRRDAWRTALTVDYALDAATLTAITAFNAETNEFNRDNDYTAALVSGAGQLTDRWDAGQELRLVSADRGQALTWIVGASVYHFDNETERRNIEYALGQTVSPRLPRTDEETDSTALYGSLGWRLLDGLTATADLRWQRDEKDFRTTSRDAAGNPIALSDRWTMWTPRFALSWQATDTAMLYASVAKGAKSGGFNTMANLFDTERSFGPETNWTYEVGTKTAWFDGLLTANAALFWIDWRDQQVVAASAAGRSNNFYTNNAARSRSRGLELELAATPAAGLDLSLAYTLVDAEFRDYQDPDYRDIPAFGPTGDISGNALPRQSRHQVAATAQYDGDLPWAADLGWFTGGEWLWQSRQYTENSNLSWVPSAGRVDVWTGLESGPWRLTLRVENLFDDRTPPVAVRFSDPARGSARAWLVTPGDGRVWSLTGRVTF